MYAPMPILHCRSDGSIDLIRAQSLEPGAPVCTAWHTFGKPKNGAGYSEGTPHHSTACEVIRT